MKKLTQSNPAVERAELRAHVLARIGPHPDDRPMWAWLLRMVAR